MYDFPTPARIPYCEICYKILFYFSTQSKKSERSLKIISISPTGGNPDFSSGRKDGGNMDQKKSKVVIQKKFKNRQSFKSQFQIPKS